MNPLEWLRVKWSEITDLPARLSAIEQAALEVVRDVTGYPLSVRQHAADIVVDARDDRAKVLNLLRDHLRGDERAGEVTSLGALPVVWIVGGVTAAAAAGTLYAVLGRARNYELELEAIKSGAATPDEIARLRDQRGGVADTIRATTGLLQLALLGGAAYYAIKTWG